MNPISLGSPGQLMNQFMNKATEVSQAQNKSREQTGMSFMEGIPGIKPGSLGITDQTSSIAGVGSSSGQFTNMLSNLVNDVSAKSSAASELVQGVLSGQEVPLHQAMIAMQESSVSFQLMVEVRNKLLDSYKELMRMQL